MIAYPHTTPTSMTRSSDELGFRVVRFRDALFFDLAFGDVAQAMGPVEYVSWLAGQTSKCFQILHEH